ncbi:hypothetical protein Dsin_027680 [Dipteronia sinensis]|uniref:Uncharacterized protein n=1 Tax=Dipteronia sinensis TaxID=43782 RepID=A0AAD9ZPC8_9ROSI|nr:hypothetical protein Dsin_027680 [Dipteronia sinensis]
MVSAKRELSKEDVTEPEAKWAKFSIEDGLVPFEGYMPWASPLDDGNTIFGPTFCNVKDCEVIMMVGLPASRKTTWGEKCLKDHPEKRYVLLGTNAILDRIPEKRYVLLGTNAILDRMKVPGLLHNQNYGDRFEWLIGRANVMFNTLLAKAARTPLNYIIDQTNVFKSARKRKLRLFANFQKNQIAVTVFPKQEELKIRSDKRSKVMGKEVPADAVDNMLGTPYIRLHF